MTIELRFLLNQRSNIYIAWLSCFLCLLSLWASVVAVSEILLAPGDGTLSLCLYKQEGVVCGLGKKDAGKI